MASFCVDELYATAAPCCLCISGHALPQQRTPKRNIDKYNTEPGVSKPWSDVVGSGR